MGMAHTQARTCLDALQVSCCRPPPEPAPEPEAGEVRWEVDIAGQEPIQDPWDSEEARQEVSGVDVRMHHSHMAYVCVCLILGGVEVHLCTKMCIQLLLVQCTTKSMHIHV